MLLLFIKFISIKKNVTAMVIRTPKKCYENSISIIPDSVLSRTSLFSHFSQLCNTILGFTLITHMTIGNTSNNKGFSDHLQVYTASHLLKNINREGLRNGSIVKISDYSSRGQG